MEDKSVLNRMITCSGPRGFVTFIGADERLGLTPQ
jgi:hypothetical protein